MSADKRIANDDGSKKATQKNKISRKEKMSDKHADSYVPKSLRKMLKLAKKTKFDPELLKISADDFKQLPMEKKVRWLTAHFLLRRDASLFEPTGFTTEDDDDDDGDDDDDDEGEGEGEEEHEEESKKNDDGGCLLDGPEEVNQGCLRMPDK